MLQDTRGDVPELMNVQTKAILFWDSLRVVRVIVDRFDEVLSLVLAAGEDL